MILNFKKNQRTASVDAFDRGPAAKRYQGLNEAGMRKSNDYRQQQQYRQQSQSQPLERYDSWRDGGSTSTNRAEENVAAGGAGRINDLDIAEKYCHDLLLAEEEASQRRKAAFRAKMEKISAARSVSGVP